MPRTAQNALYAMPCMVVVPWARGVTECAMAQNRRLLCCALLWCTLAGLVLTHVTVMGKGKAFPFIWCGFTGIAMQWFVLKCYVIT